MKIPYGISDFRKLISEGYFFVDRTPFVKQLEDNAAPYIFFLRPRRFGKSLFISILHHYYGVEHAADFKALFGNTWIGGHPTPMANQFLVLRFEFSRIRTETQETTFQGFLSNVKYGGADFLQAYGLEHLLPAFQQLQSPEEVVKFIAQAVKAEKQGQRIFLLIDEYDHFANELVSFNLEGFKNMVSRNGFVRKFFEAIKTATGEGVVDRMFVTGVSPLTLDSLTSGFNIGDNISLHPDFHQMMGFTEAEVEGLLQGIAPGSANLATVLDDLRTWYNGYRFSLDAPERLYNPDMVLYFAKDFVSSQRYPRIMLDTNIASDYGKIRRLFSLDPSGQMFQHLLDELVQEGSAVADLTRQFSFERPFSRDDLLSLLFYLGMVTIQEPHLARIRFTFPNRALRELYFEQFANWLAEQAAKPPLKPWLGDLVNRMAETGDVAPFLAEVEKVLLALSNRDARQFDEKHLKAILVSLLHAAGLYLILSEPETERRYPDILLLPRKPYVAPHHFAFELKYLKNSESRKAAAVAADAEVQLRSYLAADLLRNTPNLLAFVLVFVGTKARIVKQLS